MITTDPFAGVAVAVGVLLGVNAMVPVGEALGVKVSCATEVAVAVPVGFGVRVKVGRDDQRRCGESSYGTTKKFAPGTALTTFFRSLTKSSRTDSVAGGC